MGALRAARGRPLAGAARLAGAALDVVRYRIGPSVGAYPGPGSAGAIYCPSRV